MSSDNQYSLPLLPRALFFPLKMGLESIRALPYAHFDIPSLSRESRLLPSLPALPFSATPGVALRKYGTNSSAARSDHVEIQTRLDPRCDARDPNALYTWPRRVVTGRLRVPGRWDPRSLRH